MLINASSLDRSPVQWLVDGMIPRVGTGFAHGPRWVGKSLVFDNELPLAIANPGHQFFGRKVVHGSAVVALGEGLYDAGVRVAARVARQAADDDAAWRAGKGTHPARPYTDERLFIMTAPFPVLADKYGPVPGLSVAIMQLRTIPQLELVVLDAAMNFTGGASLTSAATAGKFIAGLKLMSAELDCFVLVINHDTADGTKMKGAGELGDGADLMIAVTPDYDMGTDAATLTCEKNKQGPRFDPVTYLIERIGDVSATVRLAEDETTLHLPPPVTQPRKRSNGLLRLVQSAEAHRARRTS